MSSPRSALSSQLGVEERLLYHCSRRSSPKGKSEGCSKGKRKRKEDHPGGGGGLRLQSSSLNGGKTDDRHVFPGDGGALGGNPLHQTISFQAWALAFPRWILRTRTSLAFNLFKSFTAEWRSSSSSTATFPLPAPYPGCFAGGGPHLSKKRLAQLAQQRALHVAVVILNKMYLGRYASLDELGRRPNAWQRKRLGQLRSFYVACGGYQERFPLAPGRSGPELGASLYQLEKFLEEEAQFASCYMDFKPFMFKDDPDLFPRDDFPQLVPYKSLQVDRLRLVGTGQWPMEEFLSNSVLWLPFQEPRFLLHGGSIKGADLPSFATESEEENLRLARIWDARGLLRLYSSPCCPGHFSKVFNAYKSEVVDRQIGDRRLPNARERHLDGPSRHLPPGHLLCQLTTTRWTHGLRGSVTDRRDYYHQARVSDSRSRSNMLPFSYPLSAFDGTKALEVFNEKISAAKRRRGREEKGDELAPRPSDGFEPKEAAFASFGSLFQGDHLGVEFALASHEELLKREDLLLAHQRVRGHCPMPTGPIYEALIIDDYFCISSDCISTPKEQTATFLALARAREAYEKHKLEGSVEKDVVAEEKFKAAGAEIDSRIENVRLGLVSVAAPMAKRIALSTLSLRASALPMITSKLASRLAGNWVSVLLYRRCLSSVVDSFFGIAASCEASSENVGLGLSRKTADELVTLAALVPLMATNVSLPISPKVYASDASNSSGAVVSTVVDPVVAQHLWLGGDQRGRYTKLDNPFRACLRGLGEEVDEVSDDEGVLPHSGLYKSPLLYFDFVEICGGSGGLSKAAAALGLVVAPVLDLSESSHYDLGSLRLLEWVIHMLESKRFKSCTVEPPCTTFSPAASPAVHSYLVPLGFDRLGPKTWRGNLLCFRSFIIIMVSRRCGAPTALEQPRRSKMAWTKFWAYMIQLGFAEAIIASCQFGSPHQKEFRFLCYGLDVAALDVRCPGGHQHLVIQGKYTKASAAYTPELSRHLALEFQRSLQRLRRNEDEQQTAGLESVLGNDILATSQWSLEAFRPWKFKNHINVLETRMALQVLKIQASCSPDSRFSGFLDSQVSKGALAKGRSSSKALQPLCRQSAAIQTVGCIYPAWSFAPTRLNTADDPTRNVAIRRPSRFSVLPRDGVDLPQLHSTTLRRPYANWIRLLLLVTQLQTADSFGCGLVALHPCFDCPILRWLCFDCLIWVQLCFDCLVRSAVFAVPWTSHLASHLASAAAPLLVGILNWGDLF